MFEQAFKNIDDVLRKEAGCTTELDYTEQTSWLLFLKYLDGLEQDRAVEAQIDQKKYTHILDRPYRWVSWAAPKEQGRQARPQRRPAALLIEAGLIHGQVIDESNGQPTGAVTLRLTWAGHEFLDAARNEGIWRKARERIKGAGVQVTLSILEELLKKLLKEPLGLP